MSIRILGRDYGLNPITNTVNAVKLPADIIGSKDVIGGVDPFTKRGNTRPSPTSTKSDNQKQITETQTDIFGGSGSGGGSGTYDPAAVYQYDLGIRQGNDALGRLDNQLNTAYGNIDNSYNSAYNKLLGERAVVDRDYGTNKAQQLQDYEASRDNVNTNTRNLLLNARKLLGAMGAGGGSADRYAVANAAQTEGSNANAQIQQTNARNLAALDTAYDDNKRKYEGAFSDITMQRDNSRRSTESAFAQQRADLLNNIALLTGQRAIANGQTLAQAQAAANPFTSRISGILNQIDSLAANPGVVRANNVSLARPDLAAYTWSRFNGPSVVPQDTSLTTPAFSPLVTYNDQQDQNQPLI